VFRHAHLACGIGAGARGFNMANPRVGNVSARFECAGGIDVDAGAIRNFERLTGVKGTVMDLFSRDQYIAFHGREPAPDWREATPADIFAVFGPAVDVGFTSMPCKGFSGLLSQRQSETEKYQALNGLTLRGIWLQLEAYKDDPIAIILFENVPRIANRGRWLLDQIIALLRAYGYAVAETVHDCGEIGGLAQSRKRFLLVARHMKKVPPFVYQPPKLRLRGVGEVIGKLPLPGDPIAGAMHRIPSLQWQTWVRLAFVPAGKDWRALNDLAVVDGNLRDFGIAPEMPLRENALGVCEWTETAPTVTSQRAPGQGRFSVADPRPQDCRSGAFGVADYEEPVGTVQGESLPSNGKFAVADPRPIDADWNSDVLGVKSWDAPAGTVPGRSSPTNGAYSVADPRPGYGEATHRHVLGVKGWEEPAGVVTGNPKPTGGAHAVADPRVHNGHPKSVQLGVRSFNDPAPCVKGDMSVGTGPYAVADPRLGERPRFNNTFRIVPFDEAAPAVAGPGGPAGGHCVADPRMPPQDYAKRKYKVTPYDAPTRAVIGASTTGDGAFAVADPRCTWGKDSHRNKLKITPYDGPAGIVTGSDRVGSGAPCVADKRRENYQTCGHYGVVPWDEPSGTVAAKGGHDNGRGNVADPRDVDLDVEPVPLPAAKNRLVCRIVALDETWHRPFTTLELASLQSIVDPEEAFAQDPDGRWVARLPVDLATTSDATKREWIGNAVPSAASKAMAETIGETLLLAGMGETFTLSTREIWVKPLALALAVDTDQLALRMDGGRA
jgi:site-specific DNA-cytosine methylase